MRVLSFRLPDILLPLRTVDVKSYTVASLSPDPEIIGDKVESSRLCGSSWLNHKFAECLDAKFGTHPQWQDRHKSDALQKFETSLKRDFEGDMDRWYCLPWVVLELPDDPNLGIDEGSLKFSGEEIGDIFDPVIDEIVKLVTSQIESAKYKVAAVLLVGGFGRNKYLHARLEEAVGPGILVREVPNGCVFEMNPQFE
jgi:hypothetical protein